MRSLPLFVLLAASLAAVPAHADQLLEGGSLRLRQRPSASLSVVTHDPSIVPPASLPTGGELRIFTATGDTLVRPLPAAGWRPLRTGGFAFRAPDLRTLRVEAGRLRIQADDVRLDLTDDPGPIDVVVVLGDEAYCMRFGGRAVHRPGVRFRAQDAPRPEVCGPLAVDAGGDRVIGACEEITLPGTVRGGPVDVRWDAVTAVPPVTIAATGAAATLRAPAVAVPTDLVLRLSARDASGAAVADEITLTVTPGPAEPGLAPGMVPDCAPFRHGVASGDPRPDSVVLWTRLTPEQGADRAAVAWELAADPAFTTLVASGSTEATAEHDFTVRVEPTGLAPATTYWYRFRDAGGRWSAPGRTRTAPGDAGDHLRIGVASCSSVYSGWFNAYRRLAERVDLDLVIHLGDYLYDFVDEDEQVRVPAPFPMVPIDLVEWRARHAYYLSDPDLRWARAMHPWAVIWDNHDVEAAQAPDYAGSVQAFREWIPIMDVPPYRPDVIYRRLSFGPLADVVMLDTLLFRNLDLVPGTQAPSILGDVQFDWLAAELAASQAAWRILGSQRLMATARINPDFTEIFDGERREIFDPRTWDGFPEDRTRLFGLLAALGLDDNVALSGDSHISVAMDLVDDPANPAHPYDPETSDAPVGVELLATSISRGNFDEELGLTTPPAVFDFVIADTMARNPHGRFLEITQHGYGVLDLTPERVVAQIWYSVVRERTDDEELGVELVVQRGRNRWDRP